MIPKKIHYCWFGGKPLTEQVQKCIASWKKFCPDYEIIEWNEDNFDIECCPYVSEAYQAEKWAFITDYARLWTLYTYGGIYMDTDVEVIGDLNAFLSNMAFSGFENEEQIPTGIIAAEKGNPWIKRLLDYYKGRHFILEDGCLDLTTNVETITKITKTYYPVQLNNTYQMLGDVTFYPKDYFCPKDFETHEIHLTDNSVTIHHFSGSWVTAEERILHENINKVKNKYGKIVGKVYKNIAEYIFVGKKDGLKGIKILTKQKIYRIKERRKS